MLAMSSCGVTKHIPEGRYLFTRYGIEEDKQTPKDERIRSGQLDRFVQPQPNKRFLGTNLYIRLYNMANPDTTKKNWWNRTLRKLGQAPVLLDTAAVARSAESMRNYTVYSGFYHADVDYKIDSTRRKKAKVTYYVRQRTPYRIGRISYEFRDEFLRPIILNDTAKTLLATGNILDGHVLERERSRITDYLKDNGYYRFTLRSIEFEGDSTVGDHRADLKLIFKQHLAGYDDKGAPIHENNSIYRIGEITINPEYDPMFAMAEPSVVAGMDTTDYRGLGVLHFQGRNPKVKEKVLRRAVEIYPNYLYNASQVQQTSANLLRLGFYKNTNIVFREQEPDTTHTNEITYIGGDDEASAETTTERYMTCHINSTPTYRHSYKIELEGTTSSDYNAIMASIGYLNRNLFRGVELFEVSLRGGYEFMHKKELKGSFEVGGATSVSFPRFLVPFRVDRFNKAASPRTKVELAISSQRRPDYHRVLTGATWGYEWGNRKGSSFVFRPISLNLIRMNSVNLDFLEGLKSEYLKSSYKEQLAAGASGSYTYNSQLATHGSKNFLFRLNWETAGNMLNLLDHMIGFPVKSIDIEGSDASRDVHTVFKIPYSQYARFDVSFSDRFILGPKTSLAWRVMGGIGFSYGNGLTIPYDRLFYSGGSNSMRGWVARTLGPGTVIPESEYRKYNNQVGSMKLESNAEFRFPVWGMLNGAIFADVGNVWFVREDNNNKDGVFHFDKFYKQLGLNTGLGIRIDIGMAVLRFDWGMRLHNPSKPKSDRWTKGLDFLSDSALNFGVGYPF